METTPRQASNLLKLVYCLALITPVFPAALFGASGWMALVTGGGMLGVVGVGGVTVLVLLLLVRVYFVTRKSPGLQAPVTGWLVLSLRLLGITAMTLGVIAALGLFFVKPIALALFGRPGDAGIAFFITGAYLYLGSGLAWLGAALFEFSRWLGKVATGFTEVVDKSSQSPGRAASILKWAQASAAVLLIVAVGITWFGVREERKIFEAQCGAVFPARVDAPIRDHVQSVLVRNDGISKVGVGYGIHADEIALSDAVEFVEFCTGPYCKRISKGKDNNPHTNDHQQIKSTESLVEFDVTSKLVHAGWGVATREAIYRVREVKTGRTVVSATEIVFDWDKASRFKSLFGGVFPVEACGYAFAQPHMFRSNSFRDETWMAYAKADIALVKSALAR